MVSQLGISLQMRASQATLRSVALGAAIQSHRASLCSEVLPQTYPVKPLVFEKAPCPLADQCVISAIDKDLAVRWYFSATQQDRLEALNYLGTGSATVYQPLLVTVGRCCERTRGCQLASMSKNSRIPSAAPFGHWCG
jgi:hypothetical protein